jgi:tetratricopeptide (TPR) repeat protein
LVERGSDEQIDDLDELVSAARETTLPGLVGSALGVGSSLLLVRGERERAHALLREAFELGAFDATDLGWMGRTALALGDPAVAERLAERLEVGGPADEHARASAQAQLAEARGDHEAAARIYQQAAEAWEHFGTVPERAYALLGQGRCLSALGDPAANWPLTEARDLFASMGYKQALAETEALLQQAQTAAS